MAAAFWSVLVSIPMTWIFCSRAESAGPIDLFAHYAKPLKVVVERIGAKSALHLIKMWLQAPNRKRRFD